MENSVEVPKKLTIELSYDLIIPLLGINLMEKKSEPHKDTSFIEAL
jgi:hypothetical protein